MKSVGALRVARAWFDPRMKRTAEGGLLYRFSSCDIRVTSFHAPNFSNKTPLFQTHLLKQEATSAFTRSSPRHITTDLVWPGGTDAAGALVRSPPLTDAIAESRTDFVWVYIPSTPCSSKWLSSEWDYSKTRSPQMQGKSRQNASTSSRQRTYPFEMCARICVTDRYTIHSHVATSLRTNPGTLNPCSF